jgi:polyhydroxyalkanoate synthase
MRWRPTPKPVPASVLRSSSGWPHGAQQLPGLNAEAQKKAIETKGESIAKGMQNLLHDMRQGHVSMTDESVFEVGRNVATTEGAVVFENELFQLIEYKPLTAKVHERPFLLVPPCINKFYILDLQPDNSLIRYAVEQGHRTFVVSWRNPDASLATKTWDDYIEHAAIEAIAVVQEITGAETDQCPGLLRRRHHPGTALAVLAARGEKPVASATLLTTLLDFTDTGILDVFIDEAFVKYREMEMGKGGLMKGRTWPPPSASCAPTTWCGTTWWATTSRAKRRRRSTCCTGTATAPTCPARFTPGTCATPTWKTAWSSRAATVCGEKVDLPQGGPAGLHLRLARRPHRADGGAYASTQVLPGKKRFVMGASGHIAGVINPPAKNKRSHWIGPPMASFPARSTPGSPAPRSTRAAGGPTGPAGSSSTRQAGAAPKAYGRGKYKAIEPAPGRYVKAKA